MRELEHRQKIKHRMYSIPALLALCVLTFFLAKGTINIVEKERESAADVSQLKAKIAALSAEQTSLQAEIADLNTQGGIDEEIKDKFNVSQAGEHVAIIVDPAATTSATATTSAPWYEQMWNAIISAI